MVIEETFVVAAPREQVWRFITDPKLMGPCIPGCQGVQVLGPTTYQANVQIKVGPIKASFNLEVEVTEEVYPEKVISVTRGEEGSRASLVTSHNFLHLKQLDDQTTELSYGADVNISGRLGKYGQGVMKKIAKRIAGKFEVNLREQIEVLVE